MIGTPKYFLHLGPFIKMAGSGKTIIWTIIFLDVTELRS